MRLVEFLTARLAEDEANPDCAGSGEYFRCAEWSERHVREAEAKRSVVAHHAPVGAASHPGFDCAWCRMAWPCFDVRVLAAVYSDHPDYDPSWRP